jgi:polyribonucleotide 5'-hydroxyl-kinase
VWHTAFLAHTAVLPRRASPPGAAGCLIRPRPDVAVVRLHSSGGVVARPPPVRKAARTQRVRDYFYGARGTLSPHSQTARFDELKFYRVGGGPRAPTSALPIGTGA